MGWELRLAWLLRNAAFGAFATLLRRWLLRRGGLRHHGWRCRLCR